MDMKIAMVSFTKRGGELAYKIEQCLAEAKDSALSVVRYAFEKYPVSGARLFSSGGALIAEIFGMYDALLFVSACGIAVRLIAPQIETKTSDPAVLCVDEQGNFVISLLSGHFGGANALAKRIAGMLGAVPVVTTATDIGGRFSPDSFAKANYLCIEDMETAKHIAAAVLRDEVLGLYSEYPCKNIPEEFGEGGKYGICITTKEDNMPFKNTLRLIPQDIILGVGCKKNTDISAFERFVSDVLRQHQIAIRRVRCICSIDLKKEEPALTAFSKKYQIPFLVFSAGELKAVQGEFSASDFVKETTGVDNVCERSAMMQGGQLLIKKQKGQGMTLAACRLDMDIDFMREII